ncbi:hypothetical protein [uncultured Muribaculum sp.]|uniref:hypothetical protein n=1 Tax=uncultured Muribaculum sp. TaxID=1918613 RepID=UPI0026E01C1C|nr:hypothetical protein [uncultured Muribaculum sp.]
MKLDKNAIYPHPIWGWTEDFIGEEPKVNLEITINDLDQEIVIRLSMENSNEDIEKLIESGCAKYQIVVECSKTFFSCKAQSDSLPLELRFPASSVYNTFICAASIVAVNKINGFPFQNVSDDYEGIVDFEKGATVAFLEEKRVSLRAVNNSINLNNFISYVRKEGIDNFEYKFDGDKIQIGCPSNIYRAFENFDGEHPSLSNGLIVRDAFLQGVLNIKKAIYAEKDWCIFLKEFIQSLTDTNIDLDNDITPTYDEACDVADKLLSNPRENAIKEFSAQLNQEEYE